MGTLLAANGGDGNLVELSPSGAQLGEKTDQPRRRRRPVWLGAERGTGNALYFVDDSENQLNVLR